ncbi:MAG: family 43 glycosylhydrolase, partial [Alistipes sp.]|nr:family 43 glycosylhydrolase [Alistipes sp.]
GENYIVKCKDPLAGVWSDPIPLPEVEGIDPSLFFDDDGRAYLLHNDMPPGGRQWKSHRALWLREFDTERDCTVGERTLLLDGGLDFAAQPEWLEGPHLYKHDGRYYLLAAEGGTYEEHSQVALVSDDIRGPYVPCAVNPILTQRDLPADRADKVTSVGHADMVCTPEGEWWAVFLGCRPYDGDFYNTGRETFLLPVAWRDGGPVILAQGEAVPTVVRKEGLEPAAEGCLTGNFAWSTDFSDGLDDEWTMIRIPRTEWWRTSARGLELRDDGTTIYDLGNPAFVGYRQRHTCFTASTRLEFEPAAESEFAGMALFQNERHNIVFGKTLRDGVPTLAVVAVFKDERTEYCVTVPDDCRDEAVTLRVRVDGGDGEFEAVFGDAEDEKSAVVASGVDLRGLSTHTARGFNGVFVGLYRGKI